MVRAKALEIRLSLEKQFNKLNDDLFQGIKEYQGIKNP